MTERPRAGRLAAEFVLIVVGVLAALTVEALRGSLGERSQERLYLEALVQDFQRTRTDIEDVTGTYTGVLASGRVVLPVLEGRAPFPDDTVAFLVSLYAATRSPEPVISRATYEDLLSTGSLRLIRNDSLRRRIVDYFETVERTLRPIDYNLDRAPYRAAVRSLLPLEVQLTIRGCPESGDPKPCRGDFSGIPLRPVVDAVAARPRLDGLLRLSLQSAAIRTFDRARGHTVSVQEAIETELAAAR